jgi:arginine/ornithine N-succinyltransferase beta subunit
VTIGEGNPLADSLTDDVFWLVSNRRFRGFRAIVTMAPRRIDRFPLLPHAAMALGVGEGDSVRAVPLAPGDR